MPPSPNEPQKPGPQGSGGPPAGGPGPGGQPPRPKRNTATWLVVAVIVVLLSMVLTQGTIRGQQLTFDKLALYVKQDLVVPDSVVLEDARIIAELKPNTPGIQKQGDRPTTVWVEIGAEGTNYYREQLQALGTGWRE
ncbi:MAG: hypothetical protein FJ253_12595, partial [Phycisphaerae bacterium]|nr:hypothetical protein [Phycisphaerae bacterium]